MKINEIVYDTENKEYVKLSNGTDQDGIFVPTEAIALRLGFSDGKPRIAFTYRHVKASFLHKLESPEAVSWFDSYLQSPMINKHFNFLGRV
jgi:hypothetical protein